MSKVQSRGRESRTRTTTRTKRSQRKPKPGSQCPSTRSSALPARWRFTVLDRIHRAMLLFGLGRSTLLRQVLETEQREGKRFERLALALNALYPEGCDERRMLEGVQAAMRGIG